MDDERDVPEDLADSGELIEIEFVEDAAEDTVAERFGEGESAHDLTAQLERLKSEYEELREMYLRKLAEFDNFRKRTEREREEFKQVATEGIIRELLPIVDNFERALLHAGNGDPSAFREGVEMIARQLKELLGREGLEAIDPGGQPFQPEFHEAVQRVEGSDHEPGTVVAVLAKGYTLGNRLIRPAMVGVAVEGNEPPSDRGPGAGSRDEEGVSS